MWDVNLIGATRIARDGVRRPASDLGGTKSRQLLEMLALDVGQPMSKELLAEQLWEERPPASYVASIESYVCVLRRNLGLGGSGAALATTHGGYLLDPTQVRVDVHVLRRPLASTDPAAVDRAVTRLEGTLLRDDPYAAWANRARDELAARLAEAGTRGAELANRDGRYELAGHLARVALDNSAYSERAVRALMVALAGGGDRVSAYRAYEDFRAGMLGELGLEPQSSTLDVYLALLREGSAPPDDDGGELGVLLDVLRRVLEAGPRRMSSGHQSDLREVGRLLLARAG